MGLLDQRVGLLLFHARNADIEARAKEIALLLIEVKFDLGVDRGLGGKLDPGFLRDMGQG